MAERWMAALVDGQLPLWLKIVATAFLCVLVPVYWARYGAGNFLWFSDIALLGAVAALWLESRLLASMMLLAGILPELAWNLDFFGRMITGRKILGIAEYMFNPELPRYLRAISLFHIALPPLLAWMVYRLGYDPRALAAQTVLAWIVLPASYLFTDPQKNVNWVFGPGMTQTWMRPVLYLLLMMVFLPLCIYLPTHLIVQRLMRQG